jgi:predicted TIM-barrel fold metal-dependent hydrolase/ribosomal protein L37AE/L43A
MTDNHIHIGQFEEIYYDPLEILRIVKDAEVTEAAYSSTTSGKEGVKYSEVYSEIAKAVSMFSPEIFKPYLWFVPSYRAEGLTAEKAFSDAPYKGIKIHPFANDWDLSQNNIRSCLHGLFEFAQDKNLPVLIHTGPNGVDAPGRFEAFFGKYPKTTIILAHCRPIEEAIAMLKKYPNVRGDTAFVPIEWVQMLADNKLEDKIILGSDFPVTHYWTTHDQNTQIGSVTLEEQYREDIHTMRKAETLLVSQLLRRYSMGTWRCSKCGWTGFGDLKPLAGNCPKGGGHRWARYVETPAAVWRCNKCGNTAFGQKSVQMPCNKGGNHRWERIK